MTCENDAETSTNDSSEARKFLILFIIGFSTILLGIIVVVVTTLLSGEGSVNFGGVIFLWFIPIVFGAGPEATSMVILAIILAVLGVIMYLIFRKGIMKVNA